MGDNKPNKGNPSNERPLSIKAPPPNTELPLAENQPRQPSNLQGLLKFAMEATRTEDAPHTSASQPLDHESKEFLNKALNSLTVDVIGELKKSIKILSNIMDVRPEDDVSEYETALECIADYVDNMDIANDFYKIGGFGIFGSCLNSPHETIRWKTANIIAELCQNNPFCQQKILEMGLMPILLGMVDSDPDNQARIKSLYAVSCIVRGNTLALKYMDLNDGYSVLIRAMQTPIEKLQIKSAFLLSALCRKDNVDRLKSTLIRMGIIEQAAGLLAASNIFPDTRDSLLSMLDSLVTGNNSPALKECRRPELCYRETLLRCLKAVEADKANEEAQICKNLLNKIFGEEPSTEER